jgi:hypothetical protein
MYSGISSDTNILTDYPTLLAIPTASRTSAQQTLWKQLNSFVIDFAQNGPRPVPPYISTHMQLVQRQGSTPYVLPANALDLSGNLESRILYVDKISLYLQSYGKGSSVYLQNLEQSLLTDSVQSWFANNSLTFLFDTGIQDIHTLVDLTYEERFSYDLTFLIGQEITDIGVDIQTVPGIGVSVSN